MPNSVFGVESYESLFAASLLERGACMIGLDGVDCASEEKASLEQWFG